MRGSNPARWTMACALAFAAAAAPAPAATIPAGFQERVISGITNPTLLAVAPDGRVFVSEQCGALRVIKNGILLSTPFATLSVGCTEERGLHGIAFDPNFATNGYVYVRFTRASPLNNVIGRLQVSASNPDVSDGTVVLLFTIPFNGNQLGHGGGLLVGADGKLYSGIGDHQSGSGQNLANLWGKVIRLNIPDGSIPTDNPFYATTTGDSRAIWAYGFHNPFGMALQPGTGRLFVNDPAAPGETLEEVNHVTRANNYAWPHEAYFSYDGGITQVPRAVTGGDFYNPDAVMFPGEYVGRYFFADYFGGWVRHINGSPTPGALTGFASGLSGPTDVEVHPDGSLYVAARNSNSVSRITYGASTPTPTPTATPIVDPRPLATIIDPRPGTRYRGGDVIRFSGTCSDETGAFLPASGYHWEILFHHITHTHPGWEFPGVTGGTFQIPTVGEADANQFVRINLTCTTSTGVTDGEARDIHPVTQTLTLDSSPAGLQVEADGSSGAAPRVLETVVNMRRMLNTAGPQLVNGVRHFFDRWSDGGVKLHAILMPDVATTLIAYFRPAADYPELTPQCPLISASTSDVNVPCNAIDNNLATRWSGNGDGAWLRFDLGSVRTVAFVTVAVYQGNIRKNRFDLQLSNDGVTWTSMFSGESSGTTTQEEQYDFPDQSARYVRYVGHGNAGSTNPWINSVTEISIFGPAPPPANTVYIQSMSYTPSPLAVPAGTTVTWENRDTVSHTVTSGGFDSGPIPPGGRWSWTFDVPGSFSYSCSFHPGMTGTIVVGEPSPTPTPTPPPPTPTPTATPTQPVPYLESPATATASTHDGNVPANALDSNLITRWSANGDGQWLQLDLGAVKTVGYVTVAAYAGNTRANIFDIGVSASPTGPFSLVQQGLRTSGATTQEETFDFVDVSARYVRYIGHGNSDPAKRTWNSVSEMSVWVSTAVTPPPTPTPTPTETPGITPTPTATPTITPTPRPTQTIPPDGIEITPPASRVTASTHDGNVPGNTVDNSLGTRWSAGGDGQWIRFDLGVWRDVSRVKVAVYNGNSRRNRFELEVSNDGLDWMDVFVGESSGTTTLEETYNFPVVGARYVRYLGHGNTVNAFNSVTEVSIFAPPPPTPTPTATVTPVPPPGSPVAINGQLRVCGNRICNQYGQPVQLRGMSTGPLQHFADCVDGDDPAGALAGDWQADVLRVVMVIQEGGYETDPARFTALAERIVDRAIARGLYVVIDWHVETPGDPYYNLARARTFFTHMTQRYGALPNVLYEVCSTPNNVTWARIRDYAIQINSTIRQYDADNIILVGSRGFSSLGLADGMSPTAGPDEISNNPVPGTNIAYVFQFFAASHLSVHRSTLSYAADRIPMFVTEWGTQTFSGDGTNNFDSSQQWVDLMRAQKISWTNWNWSDSPFSSGAFVPGTCPSGPYEGTAYLKPAGLWIRERIQTPSDDWPTTPPAP